MADEPAKQSGTRRVKNPETFRERALKVSEADNAPKRRTRVRGAISRPLKLVFSPVSHFLSKVFNRQPFKFIGKILRWIGLIIVPIYLRNSWKELRLVTWPNWKESRALTFAVLAFAVVFGGVIALVDYGLDKVFKSILLK
jgi:preprotein translocase SecE subunit